MLPPFALRLMGQLHCVSLRYAKRATHAAALVVDRPGPTSRAENSAMAQLDGGKAYEPSLNSEPGCIKAVDTFRGAGAAGYAFTV